MRASAKLKYLVWAATRLPAVDCACPGCDSTRTHQVKRKYAVTSLRRCDDCALLFRVPKGSPDDDGHFYDSEYEQQSTTTVPDDASLEILKATSFRGIGKDYSGVIDVLQASGVEAGSCIYDFGSSWGYGSWQFRQHGYQVYSYEVARTRARFAAQKLDCLCLADPLTVPDKVDCFFASHVLEHLANPNLLWATASQVLRPGGCIVIFVPNGEPLREHAHSQQYHQLWGRVHPLLLTAESLCHMANRHGFFGQPYSSPYDLESIGKRVPGRLDGDELLFIAHKRT